MEEKFLNIYLCIFSPGLVRLEIDYFSGYPYLNANVIRVAQVFQPQLVSCLTVIIINFNHHLYGLHGLQEETNMATASLK